MQRTFLVERKVSLAATDVESAGGRVDVFETDAREPNTSDLAAASAKLAELYPGDTVTLLTPTQWQAKWDADEAARKAPVAAPAAP